MADVIGAISNAISLTTRLREISRHIEEAEFKNLLADLSLELAEVKLQLADVLEENVKLREQVLDLSEDVGEKCPSCTKRSFTLKSTSRDPSFTLMHVNQYHFECSSCKYTETRSEEP
ncbi:TPA: hypothetical protein RQJ76_004418 [Vibrio vulnificus]|nr:hypothetical protein [Vibrio vulnificus]HAT8544679.1 hypothetical protein [Vibrio vulnificus]HDY7563020.1 hypothetical protein [Vibrio vulnificus]